MNFSPSHKVLQDKTKRWISSLLLNPRFFLQECLFCIIFSLVTRIVMVIQDMYAIFLSTIIGISCIFMFTLYHFLESNILLTESFFQKLFLFIFLIMCVLFVYYYLICLLYFFFFFIFPGVESLQKSCVIKSPRQGMLPIS